MPQINSTLRLIKYEALGNDYLVLDEVAHFETALPLVPRLCERHRGVGADGVLLIDPESRSVRIVNPDGSEAEKSGNGLRIAAAHLVLARGAPREFTLRSPAGPTPVRVLDVWESGMSAELDIGVPKVGPLERLEVPGVDGYAVDVGNPHFVVVSEPVRPDRARELGPTIEHHPRFPQRTNVQLMAPVNGGITIEIWERGAGYTLASGTSAAAAAAAAIAAGVAGDRLTVGMPGGSLAIRRTPEGSLIQTGPAQRVCLVEVLPADLS